ncbi:MAG: polyphenol oxidase family protein [Synergistaceae bacterium]|jgi:copper oxidase (laccase) domain-containing protein|nr:polyphenol oxidase family protein [Synergistaceae bacterium]
MKGFVEEQAGGQRWLRLLPPEGAPVADIRLFLRGELLDGAEGRALPMRKRLIPLLGEEFPMIAPRQMHGVTILDSIPENTAGDGDGILLDAYDMEASLRFADCAPVVVAPAASGEGGNERGNKPWVLLMHSGYRGTVQNIVKAGLDAVRRRYGSSAVESSWAWVGPCIGGANYPRDREEWTERGLGAFHPENVRPGSVGTGAEKREKIFFDIAGELRLQLREAGIAEDRIFLSGMDTFLCKDRCYSWRGGDSKDRMFLWCRLTPPER